MYTVCYNGQEKTFATFDCADSFCWTLMQQKTGSDIWQNDTLVRTYMYNPFSGLFEIN